MRNLLRDTYSLVRGGLRALLSPAELVPAAAGPAVASHFKGRTGAVYGAALAPTPPAQNPPVATPAPPTAAPKRAVRRKARASSAAPASGPPESSEQPSSAEPQACTLRETGAMESGEESFDMIRRDARDGILSLVRDALNLRYIVVRTSTQVRGPSYIVHIEPGLRDPYKKRAQQEMLSILRKIAESRTWEPPVLGIHFRVDHREK